MAAMLPVLSSRLWYRDGSNHVAYGEKPPRAAPRHGVEVIVYYHEPPYVTVAHGSWEGYRWKEEPDGEWFVSGPSMADDEFARLLARATRAARP